MSTARLTFSVAELTKAAERKRDERIKAARDAFKNRLTLKQRRDKWRAEAEQAIRDLSRGLAGKSDSELSGFRIKEMPTRRGEYSRTAEQERDEQIKAAEQSFAFTMRRIVSLGGADKEELQLTPTMLKEFFAL